MIQMKFRAVDEAHSRAIQEALFAAGCSWAGETLPRYWKPVSRTFTPYIYTDEGGKITWDASPGYFHEKDVPEYLLFQGELVEAGGDNPTFEEAHVDLIEVMSKALTRAMVGEAVAMPGTSGFTMAVFKAADVPVGTKLYA